MYALGNVYYFERDMYEILTSKRDLSQQDFIPHKIEYFYILCETALIICIFNLLQGIYLL